MTEIYSPLQSISLKYSRMVVIPILLALIMGCKLDEVNPEICESDLNAYELDSVLSDQTKYNDLKAYLFSKLSSGQSFTILVQKMDATLSGGFGWAKCNEYLNSNQAIFDIGSATKMFTALAIFQLMEKGQLTLQDNLALYFSELPNDKKEITIQHLLTHSSGLEMYHDKKGDFESLTKAKAFERICKQKLHFKPGASFQYSNSGYTLLAIIIEKLTNKSFGEYIRENIFIPLNMDDSGFHGGLSHKGNHAKGYGDYRFQNNLPANWPSPSYTLTGNGGIICSAKDLMKFQLGINKLISKSSLELMTEPALVNSRYSDVFPNDVFQAIAWNNYNHPTLGTVLFYGGVNNYGFVSRVRWYKDRNVIIVVLMNNFRNSMKAPIISETELNEIENIMF